MGEDNSRAYFDRALAALDGPIAYSAVITQAVVSELAAQRYKVMLSGDGGEEAFGGYKWYDNLDAPLVETRKKSIRGWLRK